MNSNGRDSRPARLWTFWNLLAEHLWVPELSILGLRLPSWDRKLLPVPFSRIDVFYAPRRRVEAAERETARAIIEGV